MDGVARNDGRHYAICVDLGGSVPLGEGGVDGGGADYADEKGEGEVKRTFQSTVEVTRGKEFGVKVVLMEDDGSTAVIAESLGLKALVGREELQGSRFQKPRAVEQKCSDCAEVGLKNVPANTARLGADVMLGEGTKTEKVMMFVVAVEL